MKQITFNGSLSESAVNTLNKVKVEIAPKGAKLVTIDYIELDLVPPLPVQAVVVTRDASCLAGYVASPSTAKLSESQCICARSHAMYAQAAADIAQALGSAGEEPMQKPFILRADSDGTYNVTIVIDGDNEGAGDTGTVHYHIRARVQY